MLRKRTSKRLKARSVRKKRVRKRVFGTAQKPRLSVFKSHRFTYVQLICDETGKTLIAGTTKGLAGKKRDSAKELGIRLGQLAKEKGITEAVFDRNGYRFHGRVSAIAEGARESGLKV